MVEVNKYNPEEILPQTKEGIQAAIEVLLERVSNNSDLQFLDNIKEKYPEAETYLVGGIVRDSLLGRPSSDYDFVVGGLSKEKLEEYLKQSGKIAVTSDIQTAIFRFLPGGSREIYDIAMPRREVYQQAGSRKPEVDVKDVTIEDDLSRRDFTINAMALNVAADVNNALIDPFGGVADLEAGLIRAVGEPDKRLAEDPLRMARAVRFASRFAFEIEDQTLKSIQNNQQLINSRYLDEDGKERFRVSRERIASELLTALKAAPERFLSLMDKTGLLEEVLPEMTGLKGVEQPKEFHSEGDVFAHTQLLLEKLPEDSSMELLMAGLLHDIGKPTAFGKTGSKITFHGHEEKSAEIARGLLTRYRLPGEFIDNVVWLVGNHMRPMYGFAKMRWGKQKKMIDNPLFPELLKLAQADAESSIHSDGGIDDEFLTYIAEAQRRYQAEKEAERPAEIIDGNQIKAIIERCQPNDSNQVRPLIGRIKRTVNDAYADGEIDSWEEALEMAEELARKLLKENLK